MNMNLKLARIKKGLTQRQLGKLVGLSNVTISHMEKSNCDNVTKSIMIKIAEALDTTVQALFFDEEEWTKCQEQINMMLLWNL